MEDKVWDKIEIQIYLFILSSQIFHEETFYFSFAAIVTGICSFKTAIFQDSSDESSNHWSG